jgi:hypothetical protein
MWMTESDVSYLKLDCGVLGLASLFYIYLPHINLKLGLLSIKLFTAVNYLLTLIKINAHEFKVFHTLNVHLSFSPSNLKSSLGQA